MLWLASTSPRRIALMNETPWRFGVMSPDVEEVKSGAPERAVRENALRKASAAAGQRPGNVIIAADTVVYLPDEGRILGKPSDEKAAGEMLHALSGRRHSVHTGVCVIGPNGTDVRSDTAFIDFYPLTDEVINAYIATGEPMDKAGAYAIQGGGGAFVRRLEGDMSCVVGLSMPLVYDMLRPYKDILPLRADSNG